VVSHPPRAGHPAVMINMHPCNPRLLIATWHIVPMQCAPRHAGRGPRCRVLTLPWHLRGTSSTPGSQYAPSTLKSTRRRLLRGSW